MPVSAAELFDWHARPGAFERLMPPWKTLRIKEKSGTVKDGDRLVLMMKAGPVWVRWEAVHEGYVHGAQFVDVQQKGGGPMRSWRHTHRFLPAAGVVQRGSILSDEIAYQLPLGAIGRAAAGGKFAAELDRLFEFRHARTRQDLARHAYAREEMAPGRPTDLKIVMSGASGAIGRELRHFLTTGGHSVQRLVRRKADTNAGEIFWQPGAGARGGQIDEGELEGCDAVIHLAGESTAIGRWTDNKKKAIRESRVDSTRLIARSLANLKQRPKVLIVASGVHYYGDRGDQELAEDAGVGSGFLAEVSREWEAASEPASQAGIRVVHLRIGLVLSVRGGLLPMLLPAARLGLGCIVGRGTQWWSWIGQDDLFGVILHALSCEQLRGGVNAVTPQPVRMHEFATALAELVDRPLLTRVPAFALRAMIGERAEVVCTSTRAVPEALRQTGFRFMYSGLGEALGWEVAGRTNRK